MSKIRILFSLLMTFSMFAQAQSNAHQAVSEAIVAFSTAADQQDGKALESLLDDHFRVVMNQLFGSDGVLILDKTAYLGKIRSKEFGGEARTLLIESLSVQGKTATARVRFTGSKFSLLSFLELVQDKSGNWKIIGDLPSVI